MRNLLLKWAINAIALLAAIKFVPGIHATSDAVTIIIIAAIFGLVNAMIRPIVVVLSCPLLFLSLGLFTFVINAGMFWLSSVVATKAGVTFVVDGFWPAFFGALTVTLVSVVLGVLLPTESEKD